MGYCCLVAQSLSDSLWPHGLAHQASLSFTISQSLLKLMSIESVMPSNHFILCCPLLLLPSILSSIRVFSNELVLHIRWPKVSSFSFSISPSNECSGLISFRIDWLDLAVQVTPKSLLQHHSSKASILWHQPIWSNCQIHTWLLKNIALTRQSYVGKVMSLTFNTLSRFVKAFLSRSKHLLILWLQSPSAAILEPKKVKSLLVSIVSHLFAMKWWDQVPWSSFFECWVLSQRFHSPLHLHQEAF